MVSDKELSNSFFSLASECRKLQYNIQNDVTHSLKSFSSILTKASNSQIAWIKDTNYSEISRVKFTLQKSSMSSVQRSYFDKIFKIFNINKHMPLAVTYLFEQFVKGISYFNDEIDSAVPIYHRFYSCGPFDETHRLGNLICTTELSKKEISRRRKLIERCYFERLIYNELYKNETFFFPKKGTQEPSQDEGHIFRNNKTKEDFFKCFPKVVKFDVDLKYEDNMPVKLIFEKQNINKPLETYTFIKTYTISQSGLKLYDDVVECIKEVAGKRYLKISSFQNRGNFSIFESK